ncbi:glycosyltransferase [Larkinella soli]|uniref:glycosyltransferase n=1 Tax=Larkinella soli TaxID=1770527 RepID=UPI000FFC5B08|nr:glycosyltransferase [Larkinella soli]
MGIHLITKDRDAGRHVSREIAKEFEEAIIASGQVTVVDNPYALVAKVTRNLAFKAAPLLKGLRASPETLLFSVLMGADFDKVFPYFLSGGPKSVYLFDAWPDHHAYIEAFLRKTGVQDVFFSSRQVTEIFNARSQPCAAHWVPEGVTPSRYRFTEYHRKDIDILQFGRRLEALHQAYLPLENEGVTYLYQRSREQLVFPRSEDFVDGLARTRISVCVPSSLTHPERSGPISTMTIRYLQSMASKCLVVGILPDEMRELFDYNPLVEADLSDPAGQMKQLLQNVDSYIPLIEKNYRTVCAHHTWANRWERINQVLKKKYSL